MKLKMPAGLEKVERNEKLSPTTGQPNVPGMLSIALGALLLFSKKTERRKIKTSATIVNISLFPWEHYYGDYLALLWIRLSYILSSILCVKIIW